MPVGRKSAMNSGISLIDLCVQLIAIYELLITI